MGTSSSGFRQEVEAEQALTLSDQLCDLILAAVPEQLAGSAGEEAELRLEAIAGDVQFLGKVIADRKRLERHVKRLDLHRAGGLPQFREGWRQAPAGYFCTAGAGCVVMPSRPCAFSVATRAEDAAMTGCRTKAAAPAAAAE